MGFTPTHEFRKLTAALKEVPRARLAAVVIPTVASLWAFWPALVETADRWASDPQYSHGYLVPLFALVLLWLRRDRLAAALQPSCWGLPLLALGLGLHVASAFVYYDVVDAASFLISLAGLALTLGGWTALKWSWPAVAFLGFMMPLPYRLETALAHPLQRVATISSTYVIQLIGLSAVSEGNIIVLESARINVIEACNGLSMLVTFLALATGTAIVLKRRWLDKALVVCSAIPIALAANILRITITGILSETVGSRMAEAVFHDLAGWVMMPLALGMLWVELRVIDHVMVEPQPEETPTYDFRQPVLVAGPEFERREAFTTR